MTYFLQTLQGILSSFLGEPKRDINESGQLQFGCPKCAENFGNSELDKYNLEVNVRNGKFNCWKCSSVHDEMHGSVYKLIRMYGNETILKQYKDAIRDFKKSKLYELNFVTDDFADENQFEEEGVRLPRTYHKLTETDTKPIEYLKSRGIDWDIIEEYDIGVTAYEDKDKICSNRIILPSRSILGTIDYWTGRDYTKKSKQKYYNPKVERKDIIFNEYKLQMDADITLVEGPFDHIVVPNSVPLLGKQLKTDFAIYNKLMSYANANVNIFLDGDAFEDAKKIYALLNQGRLQGKVRYIPVNEEFDPSEIYRVYGKKGIITCLKNATTISNVYLT